jgi:endoglucanase
MPARPPLSTPCCIQRLAPILLLSFLCVGSLWAQSAFVRVSQVGYEAGQAPFRAYLMATSPVSNATFKVLNSKGDMVHSGRVGALLGNWSHSKKISYSVYAIEFSAPAGDLYQISTSTPAANSPRFAVNAPDALYSGLLLNTLFFYQSQRDGAHYIPNSLRSAPGHLKDKSARVYETPLLDANDFINHVPPAPPLVSAQFPNIDASGGWWDAGDYEKYVAGPHEPSGPSGRNLICGQ